MVSHLGRVHRLVRWVHRDHGQGMVEYGLIIALIALAAVGGLTSFGGNVGGFYDVIQTAVNALSPSGS